VKDNSHRW